MRGVDDELAPDELLLGQPVGHRVVRGGERAQLGRALLGHADAELAVGDPPGGVRDPLERPREPPGEEHRDRDRAAAAATSAATPNTIATLASNISWAWSALSPAAIISAANDAAPTRSTPTATTTSTTRRHEQGRGEEPHPDPVADGRSLIGRSSPALTGAHRALARRSTGPAAR